MTPARPAPVQPGVPKLPALPCRPALVRQRWRQLRPLVSPAELGLDVSGIDLSPDRTLAYYNDTETLRTDVFDVRDGELTRRRPFVTPETGHPDGLTCPPDMARRSLAMYYFTEESAPVRRSTNYQARPDEGRLRKASIAADRTVLDVYDRLKRRLGISDEAAHKVLAGLSRLRRRR